MGCRLFGPYVVVQTSELDRPCVRPTTLFSISNTIDRCRMDLTHIQVVTITGGTALRIWNFATGDRKEISAPAIRSFGGSHYGL